MSFRNGIAALLAATMLAGCAATKEEPKELRALVPTGAPAVAMAVASSDVPTLTLDYTQGTDLLTAELAKSDGDYDIIVAPVNLGLKAYSENPTYKCAGVLTWGNLYMVGTDEDALTKEDAEIAAFGEQAIPGMVFKTVEQSGVKGSISWYPSVAEAQQALLAGKADAALLAEPAATAARLKNPDLKVLDDLQENWQASEGSERKGYPQAALFVKDDVDDDVLNGLKSTLDSVNVEDESGELEQIIEDADPEKLGVPNAKVAVKSWKTQNIELVSAKDAKKDIETFLKKLKMEIPEGSLRD